MSQTNKIPEPDVQRKRKYIRGWISRLALVVYDIIAVNSAVYLALVTRFYVAKEFHGISARYFDAYDRYALAYTIFCIVVFACFKLYSSIWKYAGFNDMNRIVTANVVTFVGHVVGTLAFGMRMPITIYCISAVIQLFLVAVIRFAYRVLLIEKDKLIKQNKASINALIVGVGGTARSFLKQLEQENVVRPVCMLNYNEPEFGYLFDGIPVITGVENLKAAIEKNNVKLVVLASTVIPQQTRNQIKEICAELNVDVQDYFGIYSTVASGITLRSFAECGVGKIELVVNGQHQMFDDCEQALMSMAGMHVVKAVSAKNNVLVVELADYSVAQNDLNAEWVKKQEKETGEEISFF